MATSSRPFSFFFPPERQGDQVSEPTPREGVLRSEEPIAGLEAQFMRGIASRRRSSDGHELVRAGPVCHDPFSIRELETRDEHQR